MSGGFYVEVSYENFGDEPIVKNFGPFRSSAAAEKLANRLRKVEVLFAEAREQFGANIDLAVDVRPFAKATDVGKVQSELIEFAEQYMRRELRTNVDGHDV